MVEYNENYQATARATGDGDDWTTTSRDEFAIGIPPEFGGSFDGPAPENYYAVALTNCYVATFKVMADNSNLDFDSIAADGTLRLRPADGTTVVDSFSLDVVLRTDSASNKAEVLLERTEKHCFILQSVAFDVTVTHDIVASS